MSRVRAVRLQIKKSRNTESYVITIPKDFAKSLGWERGDILFVEVFEDKLIVYKPKPS